MKSGLLLDVVVTQSTSIFQLFTCKNQSLLIWWDSFFVLDLSFYILNGITGFNFQSDGFPGQSFDKDLHTSSKTQDKMKSGLLLDVVVTQSTSIFQLFTCKNQSLLIWWDSFLVLNLGLDILNGITGFNFQSDGFPCQSFDKDLHTSSETQDKM